MLHRCVATRLRSGGWFPCDRSDPAYSRLVPSALLFILLGVMWAVVLVPMWLRKHDAADESRSVDRFHRALSSLSGRLERDDTHDTVVVRQGKVPTGRDVLMPGRPEGAQQVQVTVSGSRRPRAAGSPAARRRKLLVGLLLVAALVLVAGLFHRVQLWTAAIPGLLAVMLLVSARRQAARRAELVRRRRRRHVLSAAARAAAGRRSAEPVRRAGRIDEVVPVDLVDEVVLDAKPATRSWDAVPTTLPTYVTAPAATKVPRVIDRSTPGAWSGAAMLDQAQRTRQVVQDDDSGMLVESFEISVPRPVSAAEAFAQQYVDTSAGAAELAATDDEAALAALLDDPRTGVAARRRYRRAAG